MITLASLTPEALIKAYALGVFPMAESADSEIIHLIYPKKRGILPLMDFHVPRRLARTIRKAPFRVSLDEDFAGVIDACAEVNETREDTWINPAIREAYVALHDRGLAHSIECWNGKQLAGGLYGVSLGGAFFGESMFHRERDASKVALVYLVALMKGGGYRLLDTQFVTDHLKQFGVREIPREAYEKLLESALKARGDLYSVPVNSDPSRILQLSTQTS